MGEGSFAVCLRGALSSCLGPFLPAKWGPLPSARVTSRRQSDHIGQPWSSQVAQVSATWYLCRQLADGKGLCRPLVDDKMLVLSLFYLFSVISLHFQNTSMIYIISNIICRFRHHRICIGHVSNIIVKILSKTTNIFT
ncbi:hypothetical protein D1007_22346 [Hordeum vulgare]|nr:hypothetical protein D1007_22346 [Hordeum vulgare]